MSKRLSCLDGNWRRLISILLILLPFQMTFIYVIQSGLMYENNNSSIRSSYPRPKLIKLKEAFITDIKSYLNITAHTRSNLTKGFESFRSTKMHGYHNIKQYTVVGENRYFIYTVYGEQSLQNKSWPLIVFNGWEVVERANKTPYICCFKYTNGSIHTSNASASRRFKLKARFLATQILCDVEGKSRPKFATLVLQISKCHTNTSFYKPVYNEVVKEPTFAINAKIAYGQKNASQLVEFMEYHLHYGAHPILIYQYFDLNKEARKVLQYYVARGDLDVVNYPKVPLLDRYRRKFSRISAVMNSDEQVAIFDAEQRLRPYKYFATMDTDEFIVPGKNITHLTKLMDILERKYRKASWLKMFSEVHLLDWEQTTNTSPLLIGRYGYHTPPVKLAAKGIYLPDRIVPGTAWIHGAESRQGFGVKQALKEDVILKHFRKCNPRWVRKPKNECHHHFNKIRGHFMEKVTAPITEKVLNVKQKLDII